MPAANEPVNVAELIVEFETKFVGHIAQTQERAARLARLCQLLVAEGMANPVMAASIMQAFGKSLLTRYGSTTYQALQSIKRLGATSPALGKEATTIIMNAINQAKPGSNSWSETVTYWGTDALNELALYAQSKNI